MSARWLSVVILGAALLAFAVYHWLVVSALKYRVEAQDQEIARQLARIAQLERDYVTLGKLNADYKMRVEQTEAEVAALKLEQEKPHRGSAAHQKNRAAQ